MQLCSVPFIIIIIIFGCLFQGELWISANLRLLNWYAALNKPIQPVWPINNCWCLQTIHHQSNKSRWLRFALFNVNIFKMFAVMSTKFFGTSEMVHHNFIYNRDRWYLTNYSIPELWNNAVFIYVYIFILILTSGHISALLIFQN